MNGFWAEGDYVGIQRSHVYPDEKLTLDRFVIIEPGETWEIFNWLQHFDADEIERELNAAGFSVGQMTGSLTGEPLAADSDYIAVVASVR